MPFTGRYHLIREWWVPTGEISAPFILDRARKAHYPYKGSADARDEWGPVEERRQAYHRWRRLKLRMADECTPERRVRLAERFMSRYADCAQIAALLGEIPEFLPAKLLNDHNVGTVSTVALDSNYVAGTSGDAISMRYWSPPGGKTLTNVYYNIASFSGTPGNVNDINLEARPESSAGSGTPSTTVLMEGKTTNPASTSGWHNVSGWSVVLPALSRTHIIVGDADGDVTDFATVNARCSGFGSTPNSSPHFNFTASVTTGGWASGNTTPNSVIPVGVLVFSDGTVFGNPFTTSTAPANDTNRRGLRIAGLGLGVRVPIYGMTWGASVSASISGMEIYNTADVPGTNPSNTSTDIIFGNGTRNGCYTRSASVYNLEPFTPYRIVATYSGATATGPQRMDIGTGENATLRLAMPGAGQFYYARANGTTDWSNDLLGSLPSVAILVDGQFSNNNPIRTNVRGGFCN